MALKGTDGLALSRTASWRPQKATSPGGPCFFQVFWTFCVFVKKNMALEGTDGLALSKTASWWPQKTSLPGGPCFFQVFLTFCVFDKKHGARGYWLCWWLHIAEPSRAGPSRAEPSPSRSPAEPSRADRRSADRPALYTLTPDRPLAAYYW